MGKTVNRSNLRNASISTPRKQDQPGGLSPYQDKEGTGERLGPPQVGEKWPELLSFEASFYVTTDDSVRSHGKLHVSIRSTKKGLYILAILISLLFGSVPRKRDMAKAVLNEAIKWVK
jgi:hypothetical protein